MGFGLEQGDGSLITPMALAHHLHPIRRRSRNKHQVETYGLNDVFLSDDLGSSLYTQFIVINVPSIIAAFKLENVLPKRHARP